MEPIVAIKRLKKSFLFNHVLQDLTLELMAGRFYALVAENGAGKSTLLKILAGHHTSDAGSIEWPAHWGAHEAQRRQHFTLIAENIEIEIPVPLSTIVQHYRTLYPRWNQVYFEELIHQRRFSLNCEFKHLSRGQKMQFLLILALAQQSRLLLVDEVTSVLDIGARQFFMRELYKFTQQGGTVLLTTNIVQEVESVATDLLLLQKGSLIYQGNQQQIQKDFLKGLMDDLKKFGVPDPAICWLGASAQGEYGLVATDAMDSSKTSSIQVDKVLLSDLFTYFFTRADR